MPAALPAASTSWMRQAKGLSLAYGWAYMKNVTVQAISSLNALSVPHERLSQAPSAGSDENQLSSALGMGQFLHLPLR